MDNTIRTAQVLGLTTSLILSGINIGSSMLTLPILYTLPPSTSTPIFREFYLRGAVTLVPLGLFSASCSAVVAYLYSAQRRLWTAAGIATFAQLPWTLLVMKGTIDLLNSVAVASKVEQEKASAVEVGGLLRRWAWMNVVRGLMATVGGLVGLWAVLEGPR